MTARPLSPLPLLAIIALALAACGEREFSASEFVDEANAAGAGLVLGEPLYSPQEGIEVHDVRFAEAEEPGEHGGEEDAGHGHSGGSLAVAEDAEAARAEFERCEASVTLRCYRAANVVLYLEGEPGDKHLVAVESALRALASE